MQHVSSSLTLLIEFGIPTAWIVFFGSLTIAMWLTDDIQVVAGMPAGTFRLLLTSFYVTGVLVIYWAMMRLKRVEMDDHFFYVTNYFKHVRYPYHQIEKVIEKEGNRHDFVNRDLIDCSKHKALSDQ